MDKFAAIVLPHQLFEEIPSWEKNAEVFLVEESLFFSQYKFHKNKILLHRASMKMYAQHLETQGWKPNYIEAVQKESDIRKLLASIAGKEYTHIQCVFPSDNWMEKRMVNTCEKNGLQLTWLPYPHFVTPWREAYEFFKGKKKYFQADFYTWQRKRMGILVDETGSPEGGKWSFDAENREKLPRDHQPIPIKPVQEDDWVKEARQYVEKNFADHYGTTDHFIFPVTYTGARKWLEDFLKERLALFGKFEDAVSSKHPFLYHSILTPMLNIGLLTPQYVVQRTLQHAGRHQLPLNSLEGFIRQIIGWREFIHLVYLREGRRQRTRNYWGFTRKIPAAFWKGETGILPIDHTIQSVLKTGYSHHIERLMILGNFMLLCEFDPNEVYRWFMEMYIDSYDWVMVPNVYGMTQFADGGLMTTKPYISSSNYILKMTDYKKGAWCEIWDALFWRFMMVHREAFAKLPRLSMLLKTLDKMNPDKRNNILDTAERYLEQLNPKNNSL